MAEKRPAGRNTTSNATVLRGTEYITTVTVPSTAAPGTVIYRVPLTPLAFPGTRLYQAASIWEYYRFTHVSFRVVTRNPTSTAGGYMAAIVPDVAQDFCDPNVDCVIRKVRSTRGSVSAPFWQQTATTFNARGLTAPVNTYLLSAQNSSVSVQGQIVVIVDTAGNCNTCPVSLSFEMSYAVQFSGQAITCNPCGTLISTFATKCAINNGGTVPPITGTTTTAATTQQPQSATTTPMPATTESTAARTKRALEDLKKTMYGVTPRQNGPKVWGTVGPKAVLADGLIPLRFDYKDKNINMGNIYDLVSTSIANHEDLSGSTLIRAQPEPQAFGGGAARVNDRQAEPNLDQMILDATNIPGKINGIETRMGQPPYRYILIMDPRFDGPTLPPYGKDMGMFPDYNPVDDDIKLVMTMWFNDLGKAKAARELWHTVFTRLMSPPGGPSPIFPGAGNELVEHLEDPTVFAKRGAMTPANVYGESDPRTTSVYTKLALNDGFYTNITCQLALIDISPWLSPLEGRQTRSIANRRPGAEFYAKAFNWAARLKANATGKPKG